jgi:polyphosphate kinase
MPAATRNLLLRGLGLEPEDSYEIAGMLDLTALYRIADLDIPELRTPPWTPVTPPRLVPPDEDEPADVFAAIRAGDILVHHPYESFAASVERFIAQAADDPDVLTIKMTLYRTSGDSPIVQSLIRAAERGKQVVVLVEIKARFDEEANIIWARKLERAGAHVVYGLVGLKTHCKTALVVRREGSGLRRYVHIGTGNYNPKTARLYVDLGLLTARPEIGADVTDLFNVLTGLSRQRTFRRLLVAPHSLRQGFIDLVEREIAHAAAGRPAHIVLKLNAIVDVPVIEVLYRAASAGVEMDLIVRGACSLQPGLPGISERVRVRSIVGEFLEHSRIWGFANGGDREWYIGSADLMDRNLDRRVEAVVPVEDSEARTRISEIIDLMLADDRRSWQLQPDARWVRTEVIDGEPGTVDTFETLKERALESGAVASMPHRPGAGAGSLDPRRVTEEVELKYRVGDMAAAERVLAAERLGPFTGAASSARATQLEDRYVDTADGALAHAGFAVRLRQKGGETIVSVKSLAHTDGPGGSFSREELEGPADRVAPPSDWPASDARALVSSTPAMRRWWSASRSASCGACASFGPPRPASS